MSFRLGGLLDNVNQQLNIASKALFWCLKPTFHDQINPWLKKKKILIEYPILLWNMKILFAFKIIIEGTFKSQII